MPTARDLMHPGAHCVHADDTAGHAARQMAEQDVGALPVCDDHGRMLGMVTDRDLAIQVMAAGFDPEFYLVGDLPQHGAPVVADADEDADLTLARMSERRVRRVPVLEDGRVVGIIARADLARTLPDAVVGDVVGALSRPG